MAQDLTNANVCIPQNPTLATVAPLALHMLDPTS